MNQTSDYDLYIETLTRCAVDDRDIHLRRLTTDQVRMILTNRMVWARLMLGLAVKLEAGANPTEPAK